MLGIRLSGVLSLGLLLASSAYASLPGAADSVHQLNEDNFDKKVARGLWFVYRLHRSLPCSNYGSHPNFQAGRTLQPKLLVHTRAKPNTMELICHDLSPGGHCRAFAPTYEKLGQNFKPLEEKRGFHLGQVNCQAQGGECAIVCNAIIFR